MTIGDVVTASFFIYAFNLWRQLGIEKQIVIRGLWVEIGEALRKIPSFKVRKTPSGDRHIIKSNSASQTLGGRENTYWSRIERQKWREKRRFLNLRNVSFTGGRKGRESLTCVHQKTYRCTCRLCFILQIEYLIQPPPLVVYCSSSTFAFCFFSSDSNGMIDL